MGGFMGWLSDRVAGARGGAKVKAAAVFRPMLEALEPRELMARDAILDWNAVMLQANAKDHALTKPEEGGPVLTARAFGIASAAMYDAYNSVKHIGHAYLVTASAKKGANAEAAVAQAAHDTLLALYPSQKTLFDSALKTSLKDIRDGKPENDGRAVGRLVAKQIIA